MQLASTGQNAGVSIQLVSPASGDDRFSRNCQIYQRVSIQLVSPASGDPMPSQREGLPLVGFHSISFPSEWGLPYQLASIFMILQFPFN